MSVSVFQSKAGVVYKSQGIGKVGFGNARWKSASYLALKRGRLSWKDQKEDRVAAAAGYTPRKDFWRETYRHSGGSKLRVFKLSP